MFLLIIIYCLIIIILLPICLKLFSLYTNGGVYFINELYYLNVNCLNTTLNLNNNINYYVHNFNKPKMFSEYLLYEFKDVTFILILRKLTYNISFDILKNTFLWIQIDNSNLDSLTFIINKDLINLLIIKQVKKIHTEYQIPSDIKFILVNKDFLKCKDDFLSEILICKN